MPAYEATGFEPPAPIAQTRVVGPARARDGVPLLIDTGADVSVIPRWVADEVGAELTTKDVSLSFYDGSENICDIAQLRVEFLGYRFQGTFVVMDAEHGILGRNILSALVLKLDGPNQFWSV